MSRRHDKGRLPAFVPLIKSTTATPAWKALSHGARSLYLALKGRYNRNTQNAVWLSTRDAVKELGSHSRRPNVLQWFRELDHYGFIRVVQPAHHAVGGHGKAPHWRLTEEWHGGNRPTRDFDRWDGAVFDRPKRSRGKQEPRYARRATVGRTGVPVEARSDAGNAESGTHGDTISRADTGTHGGTITSKPLPAFSLARISDRSRSAPPKGAEASDLFQPGLIEALVQSRSCSRDEATAIVWALPDVEAQ